MKPDDARKEVLEMLRERCGFKVPEYRLSGKTRSSIGSLGTVYRHLLALTETMRIEESKEARRPVKVRRSITARENTALKELLGKTQALQANFQNNLNALARQIISELGTAPPRTQVGEPPAFPPAGSDRAILEPLRCQSCGASLSPPTSKFIKCNYCGTAFEIDDYINK